MRKTEGIQIFGPKITCLFYADDGLILAKDKEKKRKKYRNSKRDRRKVWPPTQ